MSLAETIYKHSLRLPEAAAREALDFIEFLEQRYVSPFACPEQQDDTELFLSALTDSLNEDFPDDISDEDLGVDTPSDAPHHGTQSVPG